MDVDLVRKPPICDFCSDPEPKWAYPARDFEFIPGAGSKGYWAACDTCHDLIEANAFGVLAGRSVESIMKEHPEMDTPRDRAIVLNGARYLHDLFATHRTGPAEHTSSLGS